MDWPSRELSQRLAEWRLCTPRDLQRCQAMIRRQSRDLPAFDSLWIDALAQARLLTPFQARTLDSESPDRLRIGSFVTVDRLEDDAFRGVYRARPVGGGARCLLTIHTPHADDVASVVERLNGSIARSRTFSSAVSSVIRGIEAVDGRIVVVTDDVPGSTLRDLLIRRGRIPGAVVLAMARQLVVELMSLEHGGIVHGDLRARNVRLSTSGEARFTHGGILPALDVQPTIGIGGPADLFDGMAPELARGTGLASPFSDQYSLGCLVWQLLAGRPPFATGDPAAKLASHRNRAIPDVRNYAPEAPRELIEFISRSTCKRPEERFSSWLVATSLLGAPTIADRRRLRRFATSFQSEPLRQTIDDGTGAPRHATTTIALLALFGIVAYFGSSGWSAGLLGKSAGKGAVAIGPTTPVANASGRTSTGRIENRVVPASYTSGQDVVESPTIPALPRAEADGTVFLNSGQVYAARAIKARGSLVIQSSSGPPARIVVDDSGWQLEADEIRLENVEVVLEGNTQSSLMVVVHCRNLGLMRCRILAADETARAIEWSPDDSRTAAGHGIVVEDSHFHAAGLACVVRPSSIRFSNVLKTGVASLLRLNDVGRTQRNLQVQLNRVTARGSAPLLSWKPGSRAAGLHVAVTLQACVLDVESAPIFEMDASMPPPEWERSIGIGGTETVVRPGAALVGLAGSRKPVDDSQLVADGLLVGNVEFRGPNLADAADSELLSTDAVRSTKSLPGIDVKALRGQ